MVETLVVIAIIVLLAGVSFSSFRGAKSKAESTVDVSNLRQIGQAFALYCDEHGLDDTRANLLVDVIMDRASSPAIFTSDLDTSPRAIPRTSGKRIVSGKE